MYYSNKNSASKNSIGIGMYSKKMFIENVGGKYIIYMRFISCSCCTYDIKLTSFFFYVYCVFRE